MTVQALRSRDPALLDKDDRAEVIRAIDDLSAYYADVHEHLESCSGQRFGGILLRSPRKRSPRRRSSDGRTGRASGGHGARAGF